MFYLLKGDYSLSERDLSLREIPVWASLESSNPQRDQVQCGLETELPGMSRFTDTGIMETKMETIT